MKRMMLLFVAFILIPCSNVSSQTLMDYISETRGDTLVVKDFWEQNETEGEANTLATVMELDTVDVPAGRVYELITNGYYPLSSNPTTPADRAIVIAGEDSRRLVTIEDELAAPPLLCGFGGNSGGINFQSDVTVKNAAILTTSATTLGWAFFGAAAPDKKLTLENCLFEHTRWVTVQSNDASGTELYFDDCYFVNLTGEPCRRNGGVYDNVGNPTAKMIVENSTHVMNQGMQYKFRNFEVPDVLFNHNTFVNVSGQLFETQGFQSHMAVVNNIFVNSNVQPYMPGLDYSETDLDSLPMGLINVNELPDDLGPKDRKIIVENNVVYWDSSLDDMVETLNAAELNGSTEWSSQMITMNSRTQAMFDDDATYPYLFEGTWYEKLPNFAETQDLFTDQLAALKEFSEATVDTASTSLLAVWRVTSIGDENHIYSDWPIPIDLSYDDADLLTGATGGFPVGDLNWFPAKKAEWEAQKDSEHATIESAINAGTTTGVNEEVYLPTGFELDQNYPNPFNPTTTISYRTDVADHVTLAVFNTLGQKVRTLVNGTQAAGAHSAKWDGSNETGNKVPSGLYYYRLTTNNMSQTKKMVLLK